MYGNAIEEKKLDNVSIQKKKRLHPAPLFRRRRTVQKPPDSDSIHYD
jgi:hypothetical protein